MKNLQQEKYKNDNGYEIVASEAQFLAPYKYHVDGFYEWRCPACNHDHHTRSCGWPISGQVLACDECKLKSLLVRTNCVEIDEALQGKWRSAEMEAENQRLKDVVKFNEDELRKIRAEVLNIVERALGDAKRKLLVP
jgi:hypothetical protein